MAKVTRTQVNTALKSIGIGFIKATVDSYTSKKISSNKGIRGGSIGPMTASMAYHDHNKEAADSIVSVLTKEAGLSLVSQTHSTIELIDKSVDKKPLRVTFNLHLYPTHAHNRYDGAYQTYWWELCYG